MKKLIMIFITAAAFGLVSCSPGSNDDSTAFTVTWDLNYAGASSPESETVKAGSLLTEPGIPLREGYDFLNWYRESDCIEQWNFETDTAESSVVLYAKWRNRAYLTFKSAERFAVTAENKGWMTADPAGVIEYSRDTEKWESWSGDSVAAQEPSEDGSYYLFFRGQDNSIITGSVDAGWKLEGTAGIECHGNIMTLLDYKDPDSAEMGEYCFKYMFYGCTLLKTAPELPATKLKLSCYNGMFTDCISLTAAPVLPAAELVYHCYSCMFSKCSSLNISESRDMDPVSGGTEFFKCPAEAAEDAVSGMFFNTGGDFLDSEPVPGRTYYWY